MICIKAWSCYPCTAFPGDIRHIEDMIEVAVRDDDASNRFPVPSPTAKGVPQKGATSDEASVEEIEPI